MKNRKMGQKQETAGYYQKKMRRLRTKSYIFRKICSAAILVMVAVMGMAGYNFLKEKAARSHTPVTTEMVTVTADTLPEEEYSVKSEKTKVKDGTNFYSVTIGDYTSERSENALKRLGDDTVCDTKIYRLTITNEDRFFFSRFVPRQVTVVRYSFFGEKPFTDEDIKAYRKDAARYFTYMKYKKMRFEDADDYFTELKGMAEEKGNIFS